MFAGGKKGVSCKVYLFVLYKGGETKLLVIAAIL
jgi:hypothetical protein